MKTSTWIGVLVLIVAALFTVLLPNDQLINLKTAVKLGDPTYDIKSLQSPSTNSLILQVVEYVLTQTRLGPFIRLTLLRENNVRQLRELSAQIKIPPIYYPMRRLNAEDRAAVEAHNCQSDQGILCSELVTASSEQDQAHPFLRSSLDYHNAYRSGKLRPSVVMRNTLDAMKKMAVEGQIIFSMVLEEQVMQQALASDGRYASGNSIGLLDGVPVAFKDMMPIINHTHYSGRDPKNCAAAKCKPATEDDPTVTVFRNQGAIIFGLTVMVEGGVSALGWNSHWQGPVNAHSKHYHSGGSSSGSAASVATGLMPIAIGFDGGGSIRVPATMSGIHGLAMTYGRSSWTPDHLDSTLIKGGPIAATATDTALAYMVMTQTQPLDLTSFYNQLYDGGVAGVPRAHLTGWDRIQDLSDVRLGIYTAWFDDAEPAIKERCHEVVAYLQSRGATVVEINIPHLMAISLAHGLKILSEFATAFDEEFSAQPSYLEHNTRISVALGMTSSALEVLSGEKIKAWMYKYVTEQLFKELSLTAIVAPTISIQVPALTDEIKLKGQNNNEQSGKVMKHVVLANYLGLPAYSVPVGMMPAAEDPSVNLPIGFQLIGDHWMEHHLLRLAHSIEQGFTKDQMKKPVFYHDPLTQ